MQKETGRDGINVELLLKIKEQVLAHPEHVDMQRWVCFTDVGDPDGDPDGDEWETGDVNSLSDYRGNPDSFVACNTTACIAGWAVLLSPAPSIHRVIVGEARARLGLDAQQARDLFYVDDWPEQFNELYLDARTFVERAQAVAERIDHFIATNGAE